MARGSVRAVQVPVRGRLEAYLVRTEDLVEGVRACEGLAEGVGEKFVAVLTGGSGEGAAGGEKFSVAEQAQLIHAGYLTLVPAGVALTSASSLLSIAAPGTATSLQTTRREPASGLEAGPSAQHTHLFAMPHLARYVNLVQASVSHFLSLVPKASREAVLHGMREKWVVGGAISRALGRTRKGPSSVVALHKQHRWRELFGIEFDFVLREALGKGLITLFETGSVGQGIRLTGRQL